MHAAIGSSCFFVRNEALGVVMELLEQTIARITELDEPSMALAEKRLEAVTPPGRNFGHLAKIARQYAGILGEDCPKTPESCMVVACADHGVARNSISAYPIETTRQMTASYLLSKGASANAFANYSGSDMVVADVGVAGDLSFVEGLWHRKIAFGTSDFTQGPAMTRLQAIQACRNRDGNCGCQSTARGSLFQPGGNGHRQHDGQCPHSVGIHRIVAVRGDGTRHRHIG